MQPQLQTTTNQFSHFQSDPTNPFQPPVNVDSLAAELQDYEPAVYKHLIDGFKFGFDLAVIGSKEKSIAKNHRSALDNPEVVLNKLAKESLKKRIASLFKFPPFP